MSGQLLTQNLSLFAKLFLDTKSVFYDVSTFRFYLLAHRDPVTSQQQIVGFFSKEKMSWDSNNVACILVFPPWQRRGLGQVMMGISYELSRREGRLGGPEKPLSSLGRKGYMAYWSAAVCRNILSSPLTRITVRSIVQETWILPEDVIATLKEMNVLEAQGGANGDAIVNRSRIESWAAENRVPKETVVQQSGFLESSDTDVGVQQ